MTVLPALKTTIADQIRPELHTTTIFLQVGGMSNYFLKYNDLVKTFRNNKEDVFPCLQEQAQAEQAQDTTRNLINIGKIIQKKIYIPKQQFIDLFSDVTQMREQKTYVLYQEADAEVLAEGVAPYMKDRDACSGPVTVWTLDKLKNYSAGEAEPGEAEPGEAEPSEAEPGEAEPGEAEPSEAEPSDALNQLMDQDSTAGGQRHKSIRHKSIRHKRKSMRRKSIRHKRHQTLRKT
jgi:hypothetical protein